MPDQPENSRGASFRVCREAGEDREPDAEGFVLAGGESSRMGCDKALLDFAGQPLIAHALGILREAGLRAGIAGARAPLQSFAPVIADSEPGSGPLGGICAALESSPAGWAVFLPVDLPLFPAALIAYLLRRAQKTQRAMTLLAVSGFTQSLPAVVDRATLFALRAEFQAGRRGCFAAFQTAAAGLGQAVDVVPAELLEQSGQVAHPAGLPALRWFLNVNTPRDFQLAASLQAWNCVSW